MYNYGLLCIVKISTVKELWKDDKAAKFKAKARFNSARPRP